MEGVKGVHEAGKGVTDLEKGGYDSLTLDSIRDIRLYQRREGYRFSLDAVLLASFVSLKRAGSIADLGAGTGVVGLLLARRYPRARVIPVELQESLFALLEKNIELNGLQGRMEAVRRDIRKLRGGELGGIDVAVSNPPFRRPLAGRLSVGEERAVARHELTLTLRGLLRAASRVLKDRGRFFLVHHPERLAELLGELRKAGLEPKRLRFVHGRIDLEARMLLCEAAKNGRPGLKVERPLYVYEDDGRTYTREVRQMCG